MKNIGIVGYGYWGKNLVRNFKVLSSCEVKYVCEKDPDLAAKCKELYSAIKVVPDYETLLNDDALDGIVIATPVDTHYAFAKLSLENGKHTLVEKPLTDSHEKAVELKQMADDKGLILMVDHTFLYAGSVKYLKDNVDAGEYGNITYIDSIRINLGLFQHDVNVLWDLAPHDISIVYYLIGQKPKSIQATGISHTNNNIENIAYLTLKYENNLMVHFNCSWVSPVKIRQMLIGGDKKMVMFNDMDPNEKIKIYDTGFKVRSNKDKKIFNADYRVGDIYVPQVPLTEALSLMAEDFINSIINGIEPRSNSELGVHVVEILEIAELSIKNKGQEILLD